MKRTVLLILVLVALFVWSHAQQPSQPQCAACPTLLSYVVTPCGPHSVSVTVTVENTTSSNQSVHVGCTNGCSGDCKKVHHGIHTYTFGPLACDVAQVEIKLYANDCCSGDPCNWIVLPVEFEEFTAKRTDGGAVLHWKTATETDNTGFSLERYGSGVWQEVAFIPTKAVDGTSGSPLEYTYTDHQSLPDLAAYRLKQVDKNGRFAYSKTVAVAGSKQTEVKVFPNPIQPGGTVQVVIPMNRTMEKVSLLTADGKIIKQWQLVSGTLMLTDLKTGMYLLQLYSGTSGLETQKIMVQ